jgi:hypothetical protein
MKVFSLLFIALILLENVECGTKITNTNLCLAFTNNNENLKFILDNFLRSMDKNLSRDQQFENINTWLLKQNCVREVTMSRENIRTFPPLKILTVTVIVENIKIVKTINISIEAQELKTESINDR